LQSNYADLLSTTLAGVINSLSVIEPAGLPVSPIGPNRLISIYWLPPSGLCWPRLPTCWITSGRRSNCRGFGANNGLPGHRYLSDWGDEMGNWCCGGKPAIRWLKDTGPCANLEFASVDEEVKTIFVAKR
jgi:hypothetical protein